MRVDSLPAVDTLHGTSWVLAASGSDGLLTLGVEATVGIAGSDTVCSRAGYQSGDGTIRFEAFTATDDDIAAECPAELIAALSAASFQVVQHDDAYFGQPVPLLVSAERGTVRLVPTSQNAFTVLALQPNGSVESYSMPADDETGRVHDISIGPDGVVYVSRVDDPSPATGLPYTVVGYRLVGDAGEGRRVLAWLQPHGGVRLAEATGLALVDGALLGIEHSGATVDLVRLAIPDI